MVMLSRWPGEPEFLRVGVVFVIAMINAGPLGSKTESPGTKAQNTENDGIEAAIPAVHMG